MKKILSLIVLMVVAASAAISQAPGIFNYQGVARNSVGNVLVNKTINLRLTIHDGAPAGPVVYQESRIVTTNPFGLFNAQVGSAGSTNVTGTIAGVPWGVGTKYIQVEIDPNAGSSFINIGTAQIASVPYSLFATTAGDIVLPFNKTQADAGTLFRINNSGTGISGAIMGTTLSNAANAWGVHGRVDNVAPGGFSTGVLGTNLGTGGLGIGVTGSQNGSGWGVYGTTPSGIGVHGNSTSGFGMYGLSTNGTGVYGLSTNGGAGRFEITNNANNNAALYGGTNALAGNVSAVVGEVVGTNPGGFSAGVRGINNGTGGLGIGVWGSHAGSGWGVYGTANGGIGVNGSASSGIGVNGTSNTGTGGRFTTTSGLALHTTGGVRLQGIGEAANRILTSDAAGNATWQAPAAAGVVTGSGTVDFVPKWTPVGTNLGNSQLFDNGTNMGVNTTTPTHRLTVQHGGSTGIGITSTSGFSVLDINAQNGDAAIRFGNNGTNQWNNRNRPGDNYLEWFELGGGGSRMVIQDGTGNVGIGETTNPTYRLDVLHGGSTGIRSRSSGSFSVVDIDAASGDAALRFANNGVNQWNMRNRPGDDYLEWFELGGGGSRMVIQDGTGNVGIGETTNPTYRLDVLHGGATGIRSRSSSTFSLMDIDAANGDAALRFARAGVNQWNIRNNPATDDLQFFELGGGGERMRIENTTGNVVVTGNLSKGGGSFKIDHPLDPENKYLYHSFVESPDMMNIYNGNAVTDASGKVTVQLPDYFQALNMEFRYQLTVIGSFAQAIISKEVANNQFEIATSTPNVKVSWQVTGVRHDAYANKNRIPNVVEKEAVNKGKYLHPQAFNQPLSKGIGQDNGTASSLNHVTPADNANKVLPTTGGSLDQQAIVPPVMNTVVETKGTSLENAPVADKSKKVLPVDGSVAPQTTPEKKAEVKPVDVKGTSVEDVKKVPATEKKSTATGPDSTKTE